MAVRTASDYHAQLRSLLPPGPAWELEFNPGLDQLLQRGGAVLAAEDLRAADLLAESNPDTVRELVPDWERVMQLPDPCLGEAPLFEDRRLAVRRRLIEVGGQTPAYFVELAIAQGYTNAKVIEQRAPRFGRSRFGSARFGTWAAQFMWTLDAGPRQRIGRRFGAAYFGETFGGNPSGALECVLRRSAPAHAMEFISYGN
ncbi:YmfQ family protein [Pseudomonas mosselii]|uniref:YmfQ family protein n=1 Tax=Pseudomonas mosselii TaxID=78327 RepID=UPI0021617386|nr:YmfQ family protein [Pseudomonas mosselii]UVN46248.1 YmfQ family protein [Pseudomonas mosselii]